jgi:hypothetical protein
MKKKFVVGAMVFCLLALVAVMAFGQSSPRNVERWEYNSIMVSRDQFVLRANELGAQGREFVETEGNMRFFKRRLP